ncbi:hypothetical protein ACRE_039240 [Hapsidospora chrysogenum ATCC 11550]|uniref:Uncharacterized protein n=1 Tax=Hapsidospora chrysogenum (strain ATCC 11550 / CBS 779.69 / DSM 880 / IAM 14645 / JCM 23072 / IMI 49137) TaxID=857340 RepID=A0A086T781_HAPC1|nr:hypothetical protein ACRE_039240 [Hapsidospora chrysogenum ATCC 11550]
MYIRNRSCTQSPTGGQPSNAGAAAPAGGTMLHSRAALYTFDGRRSFFAKSAASRDAHGDPDGPSSQHSSLYEYCIDDVLLSFLAASAVMVKVGRQIPSPIDDGPEGRRRDDASGPFFPVGLCPSSTGSSLQRDPRRYRHKVEISFDKFFIEGGQNYDVDFTRQPRQVDMYE